MSCYQAARLLVAKKETTWETLESAGRATKRLPHNFGETTTIRWLLTGHHVGELEYQETGRATPPNAPHEPPPTRDVNRNSGTESAHGGSLR